MRGFWSLNQKGKLYINTYKKIINFYLAILAHTHTNKEKKQAHIK